MRLWPLLLGAAAASDTVDGIEFHTPEDARVGRLAGEGVRTYCGSATAFQGSVDRAAAHDTLKKLLGGENVFVSILKRAESPEEVSEIFEREYGTGWLVKRGLVIILAVVAMLFCCLGFLFSLCRCCAYERPTKQQHKYCAFAVIGVVLAGLLICTLFSFWGYGESKAGLDNLQCTTVRMLDTLLSGEDSPSPYIGLLPMLKQFKEAAEVLDDDSGFMLDAAPLLHTAEKVNTSATAVTGTLKLLKDMMSENLSPKASSGASSFHKCIGCEALSDKVDEAVTAFSSSAAGSLASINGKVRRSMTTEAKQRMKRDLLDSSTEIIEIKNTVRGMVSEMLEDGLVKQMKDREALVGTLLLVAVLLVAVVAIMLSCCAGVSVYRFTYHEMDPEKEEKGEENPYNKRIHKYAHTTWCCGFIYMISTWTVSGLIFAVAAPSAGICLVLDGLDGSSLQQMAPGLGLNMTADKGVMMKDVVDKCFRAHSASSDQYLLDIIFKRENGRKVTLREKLQENSQNHIFTNFASIAAHAEDPMAPLAQDSVFMSLRQVLAQNGMDAMIVAEKSRLESSASYADMLMAKYDLREVVETSVACGDHVVSPGMGALSDRTIRGIGAFVERLETLGTQAGGTDCTKTVSCPSASADYTKHKACTAGNRFVGLKQQLRSASRFRCDLFESPNGGGYCDPKDRDCHRSDGSLRRKHRTCTLSEFVKYVRDFDQRLERLLAQVDDKVRAEMPNVKTAMSTLMRDHAIDRTDALANGATCNFVATYYQEFIDGLCYQTLTGVRTIALSYSFCAGLTVFLVATMYAVWCRSKGNVENWNPDRTEYEALKKKQQEEEEARKRAREKKDKKEDETWILGNPDDDARRQLIAPSDVGPPAGGNNNNNNDDTPF